MHFECECCDACPYRNKAFKELVIPPFLFAFESKKIKTHAEYIESRLLNVKVTNCAVHEKLNNTAFFTVSSSEAPHCNFHHPTLNCMHIVFFLCLLLFNSDSVLFTSSVQCSLHQLCGHGVSHGASGHCQGDQSDTGEQPSAWCDHRPLQSVDARHHAHWQSEEVSEKPALLTFPWDGRCVISHNFLPYFIWF